MATKFYKPETKERLVFHLADFHTQALAHLAPAMDEDPDPVRILELALKGMPKADLIDLHQLIHLGRGQ